MAVIGFHCSHEQIHPRQLLADVQRAEQVGFDAAMSSDHFVPWSRRQGQSGFAFSWLGAALATTDLPFGMVNAPGQRYHPAIVAQALATLGAMFPGRIWAALGSGEAANERITGDPWPPKDVRDARLLECVDVIRRLHAGEEVTHDGLVTVNGARLWTLPVPAPHLVGPAISVKTAGMVASWADGLITVNQPHDKLRQMIDAYREAGGRGPVRLQVHLSWDPSQDKAEAIAHDQWRSNTFSPPAAWDIDSVEVFDITSEHVPLSKVREVVLVSNDLDQHAGWLAEYLDLGFDELFLHHVGQDQAAFQEAFGERVLPQLRGR
ncbi:MAG TPA: TIGR03885 family FMN-dependent LLM class oxidoreductase [Nocardioidaceae bacterium]|nr:TIGR03885 family FMN-dependent LLM class oxidoreductase [Nocardioidaceae bacterium]